MTARARTILVGYDGSAAAQRALDAAADLTGYGSSLTVVTVRAGELGHEVSAAARERLLSRQLPARYLEPVGEPAEKLIEAAREIGADLVVVGQRDGGKVVRGAPCDVLVVR